MTAYEQSLDPYFDAAMDEELANRRKIQPLQKIFDILNIGNYVSANVADELVNAILYSQGKGGDAWKPGDLLAAVVGGITGREKKTYENVLRDTLKWGTEKIFPNAPEGKRRGQWDYADFVGLIADVVLDPLTWVTFGGSAKGAQVAADAFADDAVRLLGKQLAQNPEQLAKLSRSKWTNELITAAANADNPSRAFQKIMKQNDDLGRLFSMTYQEARQRALSRTASQLPGLGEEIISRGVGQTADVSSLAQRTAQGAYEHAGERFKLRFLGNELGVGEATKFAQTRAQTWETFTNALKQRPGVASVRNAIWSVFNRGKIGELKRAIGIRNPYQEYLRKLEREQGEIASAHVSMKLLNEAYDPISKLSDDELSAVRTLMSEQEDIATAAFRAEPSVVVPAGAKRAEAKELTKQANAAVVMNAEAKSAAATRLYEPQVVEAANKLKSTLEGWQARASEMATDIGESELKTYEWYLPEIFRMRGGGTGSGNARAVREFTFNEQIDKEARLLKFVFGIDDDTARLVVQNNVSGFGTDLRELLAAKALQQGKLESRYNMIKTFREFGLNLDDVAATPNGAKVATDIRMGGRDIQQLGLKAIDHPAFKTVIGGREVNNYLFDYDVADTLQRALEVTGSQRTQIGKMFHSYMNWWKGMVLLNSGYTMRNFYSNTMTQFMRHGTRAFNPKEVQQSIAAVAYIMKQSNPKNLGKVLDSFGKTESWLNSMLNTRIGPRRTLRELAEEAHRRGAISEQLFAFDAEDIAEKVVGKGGQPVRTAARKVNTMVENIPRFQSFLIDYVDNVGEEAAEDGVLTWAARQARQWFIDYGDLTPFEQKYMKNIIPFYTWMRKNLANQVNGIALYPELYGLVPKIERAVSYEDPDYNPELIPDWMRNEAMFPVAESEPGRYRLFRPDFAYQDLNLLPMLWSEDRLLPYFSFDEVKNELINATAPWIRNIAGRMTTENGYNYFYREDLGETGDAPYLMRLFASNPGTLALIDGGMKMIGVENGSGMTLDENGKLQIDAQLAQTLEDFLPVLRQAEMLLMLPTATIPGFEQAIESTLHAYDDYDSTQPAQRAERWLQILSYFLGIKLKDVDLEKEKQRLGYDIYYRAVDQYNEDRAQNPSTQLRKEESRNRTLQSIRRLGG